MTDDIILHQKQHKPKTQNPTATMSPLEKFSKWLQLKIYQLEVTFSVYIFTPLEKFIFCKPNLPFVSFPLSGRRLTAVR